jgi:CheY-like chemotaxis protein
MKSVPLQQEIVNSLNLEGHNLLIAEDDIFFYEIMEYILSETKANLFHAATGPKVIEMIQTLQMDFVFLDLHLPELNGMEIIKQIRHFNTDLPVIAQTAFIFHKEKRGIFNAGFNDLMIKPYSKADIFGILNKYLKTKFQEYEIDVA